MTAAVAGAASRTAAAGAVRSGAVTQAERDNLARKVAAAQAKNAPPAASAAAPKPAPAAAPSAPRRRRGLPSLPRFGGGGESVGQSAAGLILGFLLWGWIILPLVRGGPEEVRDTLRAKFLNKDADGRWLP